MARLHASAAPNFQHHHLLRVPPVTRTRLAACVLHCRCSAALISPGCTHVHVKANSLNRIQAQSACIGQVADRLTNPLADPSRRLQDASEQIIAAGPTCMQLQASNTTTTSVPHSATHKIACLRPSLPLQCCFHQSWLHHVHVKATTPRPHSSTIHVHWTSRRQAAPACKSKPPLAGCIQADHCCRLHIHAASHLHHPPTSAHHQPCCDQAHNTPP